MIKQVLHFLSGGFLNGVKGVSEVFVGNKASRDEYAANQNAAGMAQYAAEFMPRQNRTKFDSLVDGINRLMRPSMWFSVLGLFWVAVYDPDKFAKITAALALIPPGLWAVLGIMVGFLFPSRLLEKRLQKQMTKGFSIDDAKKRIELAKEIRKIVGNDDDLEKASQFNNASIEAWKAKQPAN